MLRLGRRTLVAESLVDPGGECDEHMGIRGSFSHQLLNQLPNMMTMKTPHTTPSMMFILQGQAAGGLRGLALLL